jgi:hypothetical protein
VKLLTRGARALGRFWWDFLVGDTPELFLATAAIVATALLTRHHSHIAMVLLPVMAVVFLVASTIRGRRRRTTAKSGEESPDYSGSSPAEL